LVKKVGAASSSHTYFGGKAPKEYLTALSPCLGLSISNSTDAGYSPSYLPPTLRGLRAATRGIALLFADGNTHGIRQEPCGPAPQTKSTLSCLDSESDKSGGTTLGSSQQNLTSTWCCCCAPAAPFSWRSFFFFPHATQTSRTRATDLSFWVHFR